MYTILTTSIPTEEVDIKALSNITVSFSTTDANGNNLNLTSAQQKAKTDCEKKNEKWKDKKEYLSNYKSAGILLNSFEVGCAITVIFGFGFLRSISEINPIFHKPLDLEQGKAMKFIF